MHTVFGKIVRYVLRLLLAAILLLLLIGLAKNNRDVKAYIQSLNEKSRSESRQQGGIPGIFRGDNSTASEQLTTNSEDAQLETGTLITGDSALNVYDPSFEQDLNQIPQDGGSPDGSSDAQGDYGFVADASGSDSTATGDSRAQLLELIKQREMNK